MFFDDCISVWGICLNYIIQAYRFIHSHWISQYMALKWEDFNKSCWHKCYCYILLCQNLFLCVCLFTCTHYFYLLQHIQCMFMVLYLIVDCLRMFSVVSVTSSSVFGVGSVDCVLIMWKIGNALLVYRRDITYNISGSCLLRITIVFWVSNGRLTPKNSKTPHHSYTLVFMIVVNEPIGELLFHLASSALLLWFETLKCCLHVLAMLSTCV